MIYFNLRGMDEPMEHCRSRKFDDEGHDRTSVLTHCLLVESSTEIKATCKTTCISALLESQHVLLSPVSRFLRNRGISAGPIFITEA